MQDLSFYLGLPYSKVLRKDDGVIVASILELPGCIAHGDTDLQALEELDEAQRLWIEEALAANVEIPVPEVEEVLPSGKWVQRVSRSLHRALTELAKREDISLNQLVSTVLAEAVGRRKAVSLSLPVVEKVGDAPLKREAYCFRDTWGHQVWNKPVSVWQSFGDASKPDVVLGFLIDSLPKSGSSLIFEKSDALRHRDKREHLNVRKR